MHRPRISMSALVANALAASAMFGGGLLSRPTNRPDARQSNKRTNKRSGRAYHSASGSNYIVHQGDRERERRRAFTAKMQDRYADALELSVLGKASDWWYASKAEGLVRGLPLGVLDIDAEGAE